MKKIGKPVSVLLLSAVTLAACGNAEENAADTNDSTAADKIDETATEEEQENENVPAENEEDENLSDNNETNDEENVNEEEAGDRNEKAYDPADEGEEREAATAKEDNYKDGGTFTGGEVTDGKGVGTIDHGIHDDYERLVFDIHEGAYEEVGDPAEIPNHFEVTKEAYPSRLVYTLSGIRGMPENLPDIDGDLFSHVETIPLFDDATIQLAAYVQEPVEFEVFEMHDPAKIVTDIRPVERDEEYASVYSVRTASISPDDNLEDIQRKETELIERDAEQVRTLHAGDETFTVEEGYYETQEEAEERKTELENDAMEFDLHIEERGMHDTPENIE